MSGYIYDWDQQWSNDPEIACPPCHCRIELDGLDVSDRKILRCLTGRNGYLEVLKEDFYENPVEINGGFDREVLHGDVALYLPEANR